MCQLLKRKDYLLLILEANIIFVIKSLFQMKVTIAIIATLAVLQSIHGLNKQISNPCTNPTDFRKLSHCITKRQTPCERNNCNNVNCPDRQCNACPNTVNECGNDCVEEKETKVEAKNNSANIKVDSKSVNTNPNDNKIHLTLQNTVHNFNNISNPIEIVNTNHLIYNGSSAASTRCQNGNCVNILENSRPCCGNGNCGSRAPLILPPYIPPPPPCYETQQFPYFSCNQQPAPIAPQGKKLI